MEIVVDVPDGKSGDWAVTTFTIEPEKAKFENMRMAWGGQGSRYVTPGTFKKLTRNGYTIMSNTRAEISDHLQFIWKVRDSGGDVLINGLGLGVCLKAILEFDNVTSVTVIEVDEDVIKLVGPTFTNDPRVTIIHADAFEWKPPKGKRYTAVWHDVWDNICADNLPSMTKLHRKYGRRTDWQGSWAKEQCKRYY